MNRFVSASHVWCNEIPNRLSEGNFELFFDSKQRLALQEGFLREVTLATAHAEIKAAHLHLAIKAHQLSLRFVRHATFI